MENLVENKFGHGAPVRWKITHKATRLIRGNAGMSSLPFDWRKGVTGNPVLNIKNQYQSSSCWGQMFSQMIRTISGGDELSAKSAYSPIAYPTGGVVLSDGVKEAKEMGLTTEAKVPSYKGLDAPEDFMKDNSWRTVSAIKEAATRAGYEVKNIDIDVDSMAQAIRDYKCIGMTIQGKNNGTWTSSKPKPPTSGGQLWAHYMCSLPNIRPQTKTKELDFYQSWGTSVGKKGVQTFDKEYIDSGFIVDVFTFIPPAPKPIDPSDDPTWWANFLKLLNWIRLNPNK